MKRLQRAAMLVTLAEKLRDHGSWCGETHIQKGAYLLQELLGIPLELDYCLYKHGPFSFDLSDELTSLRADKIFDQEKQPYPYGPKLKPGEMAQKVRDLSPKTLAKYEQHINFIADNLGDNDVKALERLATALYVTKEGVSGGDVNARATRLHEFKPHVPMDEARQAVERIDRLWQESAMLRAA
ncbi:hypothetical protein [Trichlorobacter sp.]|jgi:uncharacterized protein YwgA|uniref:hypothetical protein n=1 Tax=Trichlorobacter sp. TaxID=2911007 RepID=UPI002A36CFC5|nr:hypothetical protein [Trichlorobacter sp.]MDY0383191.1 hypothetical protein [Trichlorobacter sp.]